MSILEVARDQLEKIINSESYSALYDMYDQGAESADAIQNALETFRAELNSAIECISLERVA